MTNRSIRTPLSKPAKNYGSPRKLYLPELYLADFNQALVRTGLGARPFIEASIETFSSRPDRVTLLQEAVVLSLVFHRSKLALACQVRMSAATLALSQRLVNEFRAQHPETDIAQAVVWRECVITALEDD